MQDLLFQHPNALYVALLFPCLALLQVVLFYYRSKRLDAYATKRLLPAILVPRRSFLTRAKIGIWGAIWLLASAALMGPEGNVHYLAVSSKMESQKSLPVNILLLIDASASMLAKDGTGGVSRLADAKALAARLIEKLHGERIAIYAFTSVVTPLAPLTYDYFFANLRVQEIGVDEGGVGGTDFRSLFRFLKEESAAAQAVILMSDGEDELLQQNRSSSRLLQGLESAIRAMPEKVTFYTVGIGGKEPAAVAGFFAKDGKPVYSSLQPTILQEIAQVSGGHYFPLEQEGIAYVSERLVEAIAPLLHSAPSADADHGDIKSSTLYYQIPLGIAILLLLGGFLVPELLA